MKTRSTEPGENLLRVFKGWGGALNCALLLAAALPAAARESRSPPALEISSGTLLLGQAVATGAVVGRGGNYTVALPEGGVLWLLNNVWLGEVKEDGQGAVWGLVDGAAALVQSTAPYAQGGALSYITDENGWPLSLLSGDMKEYSQARKFRPRAGVAAGGKYYVFYSVLNHYGLELYDYFHVGQGVAVADKPGGPYQKIRGAGSYRLWSDIEPAFGSAALPDDDGWVYVYGRVMTAPGEYGAALARVRPENLGLREKYSYYSVDTASGPWTDDAAEASMVLDAAPEEFSVSYNDHLKSYLAVYTDPGSGGVVASAASYPWGPWGEPELLLACQKDEYCEGAKEHPVFSAAEGRTIFLTVEKKNAPYLYRIDFR